MKVLHALCLPGTAFAERGDFHSGGMRTSAIQRKMATSGPAAAFPFFQVCVWALTRIRQAQRIRPQAQRIRPRRNAFHDSATHLTEAQRIRLDSLGIIVENQGLTTTKSLTATHSVKAQRNRAERNAIAPSATHSVKAQRIRGMRVKALCVGFARKLASARLFGGLQGNSAHPALFVASWRMSGDGWELPSLHLSACRCIIGLWRNAPPETSLAATTRAFLSPTKGRLPPTRLSTQRRRIRPPSNSAASADSRVGRRAPVNSPSSNARKSPARRRCRAGRSGGSREPPAASHRGRRY